jgi:hypothetical protein
MRIFAEDVMDLLVSSVAKRLLGNRKRDIRVAGYVEIKNLALIWCRGAKRANDDGSGDWLG